MRINLTLAAALLLCSASGAYAIAPPAATPDPQAHAPQAGVVTGVVYDDEGEPLVGATVMEIGTTNGVATDVDGKFTLRVKPGAKLKISYVGYKSKEVNAEPNMSVTLETEAEMLDQVVVVGFGTQKKVNLTGSVGVATSKDIEARPVRNVTEALQGVVPGLQLTHNAGDIETTMSIQIRGQGTINSNSSSAPLILIDGMEGDLNTVNPDDVESISVLKDASASAIYGSRAAFGVIMVTTKKGKTGNAKVSYNNSFRYASPIGMPKMMNSYDFAVYYNEASKNGGGGTIFTDEVMLNMIKYQQEGGINGQTNIGTFMTDGNVWGKPAGDPYITCYANVDWFKEIYKSNNFSMEHNASVSGGNDTMNYYASLGYLDYNGMLRHGGDEQQRYNASGKFSVKLSPFAQFSYSTRFVRTDSKRPTNFGSGFYEKVGRQTWPNLPVYDENGYYHNCNSDTPAMQLALGGDKTTQRDELYQQAAVVLTPLKGWQIHAEFNYSTDLTNVHQVSLPYYNHKVDGSLDDGTPGKSSVYQSEYRENYMNWNIYTDYNWTINKMHNFKAVLGMQSEEMRYKFFSAQAYGLQDETLPEINLTTGLQGDGTEYGPFVYGYRESWSLLGYFARVNYDYNSRYLAEVSLRYDGSSRFRKGNRWAWAPSASVGWNVAQEEFWKESLSWWNQLKIRTSYGVLANQNPNASLSQNSNSKWYPTYRTMTLNTAYGSWLQDGSKPNTAWVNDFISASLTWEKVRTWDIGLDLGMFNNRLTATGDYFIRYTDNMVGTSATLPATLGLGAPKANNADLRTNGWEIQVTWRDQLTCGLSYSVTASLSDARSYVRKFEGNSTNSLSNYIAGQEIGQIWGYQTIGIAKTDEEMQEHLAVADQTALGSSWAAGDIMYADLNGDGKVDYGAWTLDDHGDVKVIGNTTPRYFYAIDLSASYKGFDIRAFFQGVGKRDYFSSSPIFWGASSGGQWWSAALYEHGDYFRAEPVGLDGYEIDANLDSYYPRPLFGNSKNQQTQTRYLQNAAYMRLKNLQVGYTLPSSLTRKFFVDNLRLYVSVDNLFTSTKLSKVFDPETVDGGYGSYGNSYPMARTWSFGLQLNL